jgi:aminoglycoside phosphotransferase (APT) family kinase protein
VTSPSQPRVFLTKADTPLDNAVLAGLRAKTDVELGIDERVVREALTAFGIGSSQAFAPSSSQGTFHRVFDIGETRVLRLAAFADHESERAMAIECEVMRELRSAGFPVPACEFRTLADGRGAQLLGRVAGQTLASFDDDEARTVTTLRWVARFLGRLHRIGGTGFGPLVSARPFTGAHAAWLDYLRVRLAEHVAYCERTGATSYHESTAITRHFDAAAPIFADVTPALLHGDPGSTNLVVDEEVLQGVLDWEDALLGDPLFDLASLCTFHPERRHEAIFAGYGVTLERGSAAWRRFWLYFLRIAVAKTVHRHRFRYEDEPGRPPASRRIRLALAKLEAVG